MLSGGAALLLEFHRAHPTFVPFFKRENGAGEEICTEALTQFEAPLDLPRPRFRHTRTRSTGQL